jgi:hypothetical protein
MHASEVQQGGFRCECGKWVNSPEEQADHQDWHRRKAEGVQTATLLGALPLGTEITLAQVGRAYSGTYRKNSEGLWDQVWAVEAPLVLNFDPAHLGFCVGYAAVQKAVRACPTL